MPFKKIYMRWCSSDRIGVQICVIIGLADETIFLITKGIEYLYTNKGWKLRAQSRKLNYTKAKSGENKAENNNTDYQETNLELFEV